MAATHSVETKIENFGRLRDCSASFISPLAQLHGIPNTSQARISQALSGARPLPEETAGPLSRLLDDLEGLCRSLDPVPIALKNPVKIKELLDSFRRRRDEQARPTPFAVIFVGSKLFKRINQGEIETTHSFEDCAAFRDGVVANLAAKVLDGKTNEFLRVAPINTEVRAAETIFSKLHEFGFES
jgi:hypothetical protein